MKELLIAQLLKIYSADISAECIAEGYPSHGSNYDLRLTAEVERLRGMSAEALTDELQEARKGRNERR